MIGTSAVTDDCFSLSTDPHDTFGADQFFNLGDDDQTQAGSMPPPSDFPGASSSRHSSNSIPGPSPVLSLEPTNFQGIATLHNAPGFATMPPEMSSSMHITSTTQSLAAHHLPGCPSHRPGLNHHHANHLNAPHNLRQSQGQPSGHNMSNHGWNMQNSHSSQDQGVQQFSGYCQAHVHDYRPITPQTHPPKTERDDVSGQTATSQVGAISANRAHASQPGGLPPPVSHAQNGQNAGLALPT